MSNVSKRILARRAAVQILYQSEITGVPADKLDLAYGYIPRGDIEETTDGRTGPDPELAYAGDPAAGLGFYCFAQPVAQGANAYLAAQGSALRAADITGFCSICAAETL